MENICILFTKWAQVGIVLFLTNGFWFFFYIIQIDFPGIVTGAFAFPLCDIWVCCSDIPKAHGKSALSYFT